MCGHKQVRRMPYYSQLINLCLAPPLRVKFFFKETLCYCKALYLNTSELHFDINHCMKFLDK